MNSGGWYLFLFLFILGVTCQSVNQMGIWNVQEPNMQYVGVTQEQFTQTQTAATQSPLGIFVIYQWVITFMTIIGSGLLAVFSLAALFGAMGWPIGGIIGAACMQMIQLPANLVIFFWLFELWTGR